ncbi:MAG: hypothetical protein ACRD22_10200 [Terriglobia bacterium]
MTQDLDTLWAVQQCLTQYLKYTGCTTADWDILDITFQSLSHDPDRGIVKMEGLFNQQSLLDSALERSSFWQAADEACFGESRLFPRPA